MQKYDMCGKNIPTWLSANVQREAIATHTPGFQDSKGKDQIFKLDHSNAAISQLQLLITLSGIP